MRRSHRHVCVDGQPFEPLHRASRPSRLRHEHELTRLRSMQPQASGWRLDRCIQHVHHDVGDLRFGHRPRQLRTDPLEPVQPLRHATHSRRGIVASVSSTSGGPVKPFVDLNTISPGQPGCRPSANRSDRASWRTRYTDAVSPSRTAVGRNHHTLTPLCDSHAEMATATTTPSGDRPVVADDEVVPEARRSCGRAPHVGASLGSGGAARPQHRDEHERAAATTNAITPSEADRRHPASRRPAPSALQKMPNEVSITPTPNFSVFSGTAAERSVHDDARRSARRPSAAAAPIAASPTSCLRRRRR